MFVTTYGCAKPLWIQGREQLIVFRRFSGIGHLENRVRYWGLGLFFVERSDIWIYSYSAHFWPKIHGKRLIRKVLVHSYSLPTQTLNIWSSEPENTQNATLGDTYGSDIWKTGCISPISAPKSMGTGSNRRKCENTQFWVLNNFFLNKTSSTGQENRVSLYREPGRP